MSGSRDKSLQDKLKVLFKKPSAPLPPRNELVVTAELQRELGADTPLHRRLRAVRDVAEKAVVVRVKEGGVEQIWCCTRDMLECGCVEARHAALALLRCLAEGQADQLQVMRTIMFRFLRETHQNHPPEDTLLRFKLLHTLTNSGKDINCFEEQIGPFLVEWMGQIQEPSLLVQFLQLITNVVKFNATYLDEHIVHAIVNEACSLCVYSPDGSVVEASLALLEAVVSYSLLPRAALPAFVGALARTVNLDCYCQNSWKLMRYVVGADIGHAALLELVEILRRGGGADPAAPPTEESDAALVRGAVFFINMALWGPRRVPTLKVSFLAVLPAFLKALECNQPVVTYEVVVAVSGCVSRAPHDLTEPAWDSVIKILRHVVRQDKSYVPRNELIHTRLHEVISSIESLSEAGQWCGEEEALLELVEECGADRPEESALRAVRRRAAALAPTGASHRWVAGALALHDRYLRNETRRAVRLHTLDHLLRFITRHQYVYGSELVELVGVPVLTACALDGDAALRAAAAAACARLAQGPPADTHTDLIDLLEKILNRPFEVEGSGAAVEGDGGELVAAAQGLVSVLHDKLLGAPATLPARCLLVLLDHLDQHYKRPPHQQQHPPEIRIKILETLFGLRANAFNCVGYCYDGSRSPVSGVATLRMRPLCSPFLLCEPCAVRGQPPSAHHHRDLPPGACVLPAGRMARTLTSALTRETDWVVVCAVLRALPVLLQARAPAVGRRAQDLDLLASTLCSMISDRSLYFPECLRVPSGGKLLVSEFHNTALPALAALAPYHAYLEPQTQQRIVRCLLKYGMVVRTPAPHLAALTVFCLETRDTMVRMLPEVLLDLSKISDTQPIAGPMLEFLSTLTRLPKVFASFVEDQYMSVFAILLPYTNPSRYNHYVVSLAHHVIAAWFLKCRLQYRRNFVRFIIHGLHNYIIMPFEEQLQYKSNFPAAGAANEDSSNRQRSSSLGSRAVSRAPVGRPGGASASAAFHVELTETCVDLLARYTSTPCAVRPRRSDTAEFLFTGGQSMTWLVGHKLVTITTSGCHQNSIKQGLCDRCATLCRQHADSVSSPLPPLPPHTRTAPDDHIHLEQDGQLNLSEGAPPQVQLNDGEGECSAAAPSAEVKRYSKHSLQHSRTVDASSEASVSASASCSDALLPSSGHTTRQNSAENSKASDPLVEVLEQFSQRFERISKEVDGEESAWGRSGALSAAGACPCWCAAWAEVHVRSPAGDVVWLMRMQNQMNWDYLLESALEDVAALVHPCAPPAPAPPAAPPPASSALSDSHLDGTASESSGRSRSGSASSHTRAQDLHKSSSDSVVAGEKRAPHAASHCIVPPQQLSVYVSGSRMSTQPINIPGSPQRQSSSSTTDDDDMLLILPEGKSRHPVRRSNSSPEMSTSWKGARSDEDLPAPTDPLDMILLPGVEPTAGASAGAGAGHAKKPMKKADTRVSCEAIPEEISGTSPLAPIAHSGSHAHHALMTFNSDPGTAPPTTAAPTAGPTAAPTAGPTAPQALEQKTHHQLQKTASDGVVSGERRPPRAPPASSARDDLPPLARSKRSNTISVMSPTRRQRPSPSPQPTSAGGAAGCQGAGGGGVTPSFVFLQLYHNMSTYPITPPVPGESPASMLSPLAERPLRVSGDQHERTLKNLDLVPPVEIYRVGVLYVGEGQAESETAILRNEYGSVRYAEFLAALGTLVPLDGSAPAAAGLYLNLDTGGKDGAYTYVWHDDIMQVIFHVATAMPTAESDPHCNEKRKYIGNDYVSIVYNDSGADFNIHTIKGQFNFCIVIVEPNPHGMNRVFVKTKDERIRGEFLPHLEAACVSDGNVALLARQLALHCALAAQISQSLKLGGAPYASNSLERLRAIKRLRRRLEAERAARAQAAPKPYAPAPALAMRVAIDDFNDYT